MSRPKPGIAMDSGEMLAFLRQGKPAMVCVPDGRGGMVARVARYRVEGDDPARAMTLLLQGAAKDLIAADAVSGACILVDTYPAYDKIKGVMLHGRVERSAAGEARVVAQRASGFDFEKIPRKG